MAQQRVESVERALTLLEVFSEQKQEFSLAELAKTTGYYKSTILRLMASLELFGYVVRDTQGIYRIGPAVSRLAPLASKGPELEQIIRPALAAMRESCGETASFYVLDGDLRQCKFRENGRQEVRHHLEEGVRLPLGTGAAGYVLRGGIPRGEVAYSSGERDPSVAAAAIGIYGRNSQLLGALALSGPRERFDAEAENHGELLKKTAKELERALHNS